MKRYRGNQEAGPGLYLNLRQLSFESVEQPRLLKGTDRDVYRRVPIVVLLVLAPFLGLAYVVFLPFIGFAMVTWLVGVKAAHVSADTARAAARVLRPSWEPALAYFSRSNAAKPAKTAPEPDAWAEAAEKKLKKAEHDEVS